MTFTVQRGDALRLLTGLADNSIDAVITDPPYSSGGTFRSDRNASAKSKYLTTGSAAHDRLPEFYGDNRTERGLLLWCSLWMSEAWRSTVSGGAIAVFCDWRSLPTMSDALQVGGWSWRGTGVWIKPQSKSRPTMGGLWNDTEYILWGSKGPRTGGECLPGSWNCAAPDSKTRLHVTEKPQPILLDLVRLAPEGGHVLDPFCGSGSTGIAALNRRRQFTGFELSPEYAHRCVDRLRSFARHGSDVGTEGLSLFTPSPHEFSDDPVAP